MINISVWGRWTSFRWNAMVTALALTVASLLLTSARATSTDVLQEWWEYNTDQQISTGININIFKMCFRLKINFTFHLLFSNNNVVGLKLYTLASCTSCVGLARYNGNHRIYSLKDCVKNNFSEYTGGTKVRITRSFSSRSSWRLISKQFYSPENAVLHWMVQNDGVLDGSGWRSDGILGREMVGPFRVPWRCQNDLCEICGGTKRPFSAVV